jgi:thioredoxin-dependent peroxiredoxin
MLRVGDRAPDFTLQSDTGDAIRLSSLRGRPVVLYWYPRDDTPGCTREACSFRDAYAEFSGAGVVVLGVSTDSHESHQAFRSKYTLPFPLLSDPDHRVAEQYGVWRRRFGIGPQRIRRVTFLIDADGIIRRIWPRVINPQAHAGEILHSLEP